LCPSSVPRDIVSTLPPLTYLVLEETRSKVADMSTRTRILLYGNSLVLGGIGASLRAEGRFEVVSLARSLPDTSDVEALAPDVIVFDIETPGSAAAFSTIESNPDMMILGVSPDENIVQLWSGRQYRELSTKDLTALIEVGSQPTVALTEDVIITRKR
jgi:hypothetical protein